MQVSSRCGPRIILPDLPEVCAEALMRRAGRHAGGERQEAVCLAEGARAVVARRSDCHAPAPAAAQAFFAAFYEALLGGRSVQQVGRCSARSAAARHTDVQECVSGGGDCQVAG